jgi:hypothetical protein
MNFPFHRRLDNFLIAALVLVCALAADFLPSNVLPYRELDNTRLAAFLALEVFALIPTILAIAFDQIWRIDPRLAQADQAPRAFDNLKSVFLIAALVQIVLLMTRIAGLWGTPEVTNIQNQISSAVFWIGAGNFVPKLPRNYFIGAITPWTLSDDQIWRQTNRLAGWIMVAIGITIGTGAFNTPWALRNNMFSIIIALSLATIATYSYAQWRARQTR